MNSPNKIIVHHALSGKHHTHLNVGEWHRDRWDGYRPSRIRNDVAKYCGYHFIINYDGSIEQCRAIDEEGIHCRGQNFSSIGVCFMGNFDVHMPSEEQEEAWVKWYEEHGNNLPVYPHRKYATKSCFGKLLPDDYFTRLVINQKLDLIEKLRQVISQLQSLLLMRRMK